uniref:Ig-like domain-containing protein n=1 Tax=Terrapene triunguis TaxID=2587831 RepID=A0A674IAY7_9SAUR
SCPGATLRSSCPASRWPTRAPTAAPCATGGGAERAASAYRWQVESCPGLAPCSRPGRAVSLELPLPGSLDSPSLSPPALLRVEVPSPVVRRDEDSALVCCVRGFYPQHIAVSWLRDGQELNASFVSAARQGHRDRTFSLVTVYSFNPMERDLGALFSCRARHPLLNQSRQADFRIAFRGEASARLPRSCCGRCEGFSCWPWRWGAGAVTALAEAPTGEHSIGTGTALPGRQPSVW